MARILAWRPGAIGDVLLTFPALALLRGRFPAAALEVLCRGDAAALARWLPGVAEARDGDAAGLAPLFGPLPVPGEELRDFAGGYDLIVSWWPDKEGRLRENLLRCGARWVLAAAPGPGDAPNAHAARRLAHALRHLGLAVDPLPETPLAAPPAARAAARAFLADRGLAGERTVVLHPGSGGRGKVWPAERFAELGRLLAEKHGLRPLLLAGCAPADREALARLNAGEAASWPRADNLPLAEAAALIGECAGYAGSDSGPTHLAGLLGLPTAAVHGPTDPAAWGARGARVRHLRRGDDPANVAAAEVLAALAEMLAAPPGLNRPPPAESG